MGDAEAVQHPDAAVAVVAEHAEQQVLVSDVDVALF
jgi:hypothetical protein